MPDTENIGTNGLICSPPMCIPYIFDGKSFRPHVDAAFACDITPTIVPGTRFGLDIDTPADLAALLKQAPDSQTATYLVKAGIAERVEQHSNSQSG